MLARTPLPRLGAIQWLRALAALAIALHHGLHEAGQAARAAGGSFAWQGMLPLEAGVDLFFVISGFVMVHSSRDLFGSRASVLAFLRRRIARIAPIYWAVTALFLALSFSGLAPLNSAAPGLGEIAASFAFLPFARADGLVQPVYSLGWTLNYEMFFYLIFALALPLRREQAVPAVVAGLMALVAIGQFVPGTWSAPWFWTRSIILEFGFGMIIGHMALTGVRPSRPLGAALAIAAIALFVLGKASPTLLPDRALLYGLPAALLVMAALAIEGDGGGRAARLAAALGDASYALYLVHPFVLRGLAVVAGPALIASAPLVYLVLGVTLSCVAAMIIWRWFEMPLTRALQGPKAGV